MRNKDVKRFWSKVDIKELDECWEWEAGKSFSGYGVFYFNGKSVRAHRMSMIIKGLDIENWLVCHTCDNPPCVNPNHLFLGTYLDNVLDMVNKNRHEKGTKKSKSKLSEIDVKHIKYMLKNGKVTQKWIADKFNIDRAVIRRIRNGESWNHIKIIGG